MRQNAYIAGVSMTPFGKHRHRGIKSLLGEAVLGALGDCDLESRDLQAAWVGNVGAGVISGQTCVPGQIALRELGIGRIPVVNVENACASSASAFQQACSLVTLGAYDVVLACGVEKLHSEDKRKTFAVFSGGTDLEDTDRILERTHERLRALGMEPDADGAGTSRSIFMDIYVAWALEHMQEHGTTREQLAAVSAKNSWHGSLNPFAQYRDALTTEDVLAAPEVIWPLTLPMCSPIGDGAAAIVIVGEKRAHELGLDRLVRVEAALLASGCDRSESESKLARNCALELYETAGIGPEDLDCVEVHDASAIAEILSYEHLGLCAIGEGGDFVQSGQSRLGGSVPVNTSGGLMRKGHPIGATGAAQLVELVWQLRGEAHGRQVQGARVALAENGGGFIGDDVAALALTLLSA